jgi:hypothetical protein
MTLAVRTGEAWTGGVVVEELTPSPLFVTNGRTRWRLVTIVPRRTPRE